ncbi:MOSC domain-containing protein [Paralimibaculum aggregatum]|uniref:MOSC domain-containing protein n=1 Tax=Paralimibaculum aggregatum TaxID=3036245 RepID=A0ABQ6LJH4_9RHOB|nr:MOSC domain-containing protein [Limibaculum sp. NKW23]GMG80933.1 MOSC domain-containing protein [Limibaculum sp. NKW23]
MTETTARLAAIHRFPVKGLGEEVLETALLTPGRHLPDDRRWALAHAGSAFDAEAPAFVSRRNFVQTAHSPELARTALRLSGTEVTVSAPDAEPLSADLGTPAGAAALAAWAEARCGHRQPGPYRLAALPGAGLTDVADAHVSILSDASLRALGEAAGRPLERRRFRGNLWIDGLAPWAEFDLVGREIAIGPVRLRITERIGRCAATTASPASGQRDTPVLEILRERWGHTDFGVYAQVVAGGSVTPGDRVLA